MLFVNKCLQNLKEQNDNDKSINIIWQQMHIIISKLTQTQRKVHVLGASSEKLNESF
jgi:hypothetical protein